MRMHSSHSLIARLILDADTDCLCDPLGSSDFIMLRVSHAQHDPCSLFMS